MYLWPPHTEQLHATIHLFPPPQPLLLPVNIGVMCFRRVAEEQHLHLLELLQTTEGTGHVQSTRYEVVKDTHSTDRSGGEAELTVSSPTKSLTTGPEVEESSEVGYVV